MLERGATAAVQSLGRTDGFLSNPQVKIQLPEFLEAAVRLFSTLGKQISVDDFSALMNHAAEKAVAEAKPLLVDAVKSMSIEDALQIVQGGDTAVTQFFVRKTREPLSQKFLPIVTKATQGNALVEQYNSLAANAASMHLAKKDELTLQGYVTGKALDGLYLVIGEEEKKVRRNPASAGSALLQKVFGASKQ